MIIVASQSIGVADALAQIHIDDTYSMPALVGNLEGKGVQISNITSDCQSVRAKKPYGYFNDYETRLGLKKGLLMTTGAAVNAIGPNNTRWATQKNGVTKIDEDLKALYDDPADFYDLCIIEFDITVSGDELRFNYIFASEEYPEFVFEYNDAFGFFIDGPGLAKTNLAIVPESEDVVSINTINQYLNNQYFRLNHGDSYIQYDGLTVPLEARINVIPCETYHIKLAITDYLDDRYDSGIFLESESFRTEENILSVIYQYDSLQWLYEGCGKADIVIKRYGEGKKDNSVDQHVSITFEGDGSDLTFFPDEIIIPAGTDSVILQVSAVKDNIPEDIDFVVLRIPGECYAADWLDIDTVWVREIFQYDNKPVKACEGDIVEIVINSGVDEEITWLEPEKFECVDCNTPELLVKNSIYLLFDVSQKLFECKLHDSIFVDVVKNPVASFEIRRDDFYTSTDIFFINNSRFADQYSWSFGDGAVSTEFSPIHQYNFPTEIREKKFNVSLESINAEYKCLNSHSEEILVNNTFLPNVITPNNDGKNDQLQFAGIEPGTWFIQILDRNGKEIFQSISYEHNWAGNSHPAGIYYYYLKNPPGDREFNGWVNVIR